MVCLPDMFYPYFNALRYGLAGLLPASRIKNKALLLNLQEVLELEGRFTRQDRQHLNLILPMADQVAFPAIHDVKTCCEAEAFLIRACPQFHKKPIRLALQWVFLLLARHGRIEADLANVAHWLRIWRRIQAFHSIEQGFMVDFIHWMLSKSFSPRSMTDIVREVHRFRHWMNRHKILSFGQIGDIELQRYLLERATGQKNGSKQRILGHLKSVLYYYQEAIDGGYPVPEYTLNTSRSLGVEASASNDDIERLEKAVEGGKLPAMAGLMLTLVIGYGLPLKVLPLLELGWTPGTLSYLERLPCRRGEREQFITLDLSTPWLAEYWQACLMVRNAHDCAYLFTSGHGQRRKRPVSAEYCQRTVQAAVESLLGYPIPINHLERGAMKRLARLTSITHFMTLTTDLPKGNLSRMMTWLVSQPDTRRI